MTVKNTVINFTEEQQIELARICIDEDKGAALKFLKNLNKEIQKRDSSHCGAMFDFIKQDEFDKKRG